MLIATIKKMRLHMKTNSLTAGLFSSLALATASGLVFDLRSIVLASDYASEINDSTNDLDDLTIACGKKRAISCVEAAKIYQSKSDTSMAMTLFRRACFLKHKASCLTLAELAIAAQHPGLAREALEESCRYQSKWACEELTKVDLAKKKRDLDDPKKSSLVWSLACSKGSASGCRKQAESELSLGQQDAARASFLRACSLGDKLSCAKTTAPAH